MARSDLLPFPELWPKIAASIEPLPTEEIAIGDAVKRVLREDATAAWDLPMADNSAMDGYAVRSTDTEGAPGCRLRILATDAYAGSRQTAEIGAGEAVPIGTGGLVPLGADAVAIKEIVDRDGGAIVVRERVPVGAHIRRAGEELRAGDVVVPSGQRMGPLQIAAAAAAGVLNLSVSRLPRVSVVSTGDELVPLGGRARPGQVINTNTPMLAMAIKELLGAAPATPGSAVDDRDTLGDHLRRVLDDSDVMVLSGGVSVGDRDLVKQTLEEDLGVERLVWRIALKPGKPTYVGRHDGRWVLGLPGNPATVAVGWHTLVRPLLLALMDAADPYPGRIPVRLAAPVRHNHLRTHLRWSTGEWRDQELWAEPLGRSGSHMLSDLARSELLVVIPPGEGELPAGSTVEAFKID